MKATVKSETLTDGSIVYNVLQNGVEIAAPATEFEANELCATLNGHLDKQWEEPMTFNVQYERQGIVATALCAAGCGWFTDNGNRFNTRSEMAADIFDNALSTKEGNNVRRFS